MHVGVIMAGGRGERLWPLSRKKRPKQFLKIGGKSLLERTVERILSLVGKKNLFIVAPEEYRGLIHAELPFVEEKNLIIEPTGRNTAPCIGLAAMRLLRFDPEAVMMVLPADHLIEEEEYFRELLRFACEIGEEDWLVTLGVVPRSAHTGYGYLEIGELYRRQGDLEAYRARRFTEKPNESLAREYFHSGSHFWNSGIFVWKTRVILEELASYLPEVYQGLREAETYREEGKTALFQEVFATLPSISIDYAVMEKSSRVVVIPATLSWSDLGSLSSLWEVFPHDVFHNAGEGNYRGIESRGNLFLTRKPLFALGVEDLVVIEEEDLLFIASKGKSEEVKKLVALLRENRDLEKYL